MDVSFNESHLEDLDNTEFCFGEIDVSVLESLQQKQKSTCTVDSEDPTSADTTTTLYSSCTENSSGSQVAATNKRRSNVSARPSGGSTKYPSKSVPKKKLCCAVQGCPYSTPHKKDLERHMRKHTGDKPFACRECPKRYSRLDKLKLHRMTHSPVKSLKCEQCSYTCKDSGSLKKHMKVHSEDRPHQCQLCSYKARDHGQLVIHLRHHTGDTPYNCTHEGCKSAFKTRSDLQRHLRSHTGEKPHSCVYCPYKASVKCNLNAHVRKVHKRISNEQTETSSQFGDTIASVAARNQQSASQQETVVDFVTSELTSVKSLESTELQNECFSENINSNASLVHGCMHCSGKFATSGLLRFHIAAEHSDGNTNSSTGTLEESQSVIVIPKPPKKKYLLKPDLPKSFECHVCQTAFAREDSLRCHLRQHADNKGQVKSTNVSSDHMVADCQMQQELPIIVQNGPVQGVYVIVKNSAFQRNSTS